MVTGRRPLRGDLFWLPASEGIVPPPELAIRLAVGPYGATAGWCYPLAFFYLDEHREVPGLSLVHGTTGESRRGHAWCEAIGSYGELVFDGSMQCFYDLESYYARRKARPVVRFTYSEAVHELEATEMYGPWYAQDCL
ncbi:MAG TPA: hypothetical protein VGJ60_11270 [Chloroflexota bacterium]|jgi:hypothetical protein